MLRVKIEEDSLPRLKRMAQDFGVPGWYDFRSAKQAREAIVEAWRAEAEPEARERDKAAFMRRMREGAAA